MAYSQSPKSPLAKALKGNQHRLPEHLKAKIEAAPGKQTKSAKTAVKGAKAVDEGRDKKADRLYKRAARQENREINRAESPAKKKGDAPSRKKSLGYYNKANKTGTGAAAGGGMTAKGTAEYRRNNPGSKLKTAVTKDPSKLKKGGKAAKRRKAFCARSKSWTSERGRAARRRWNC
jgi:hypothetical protein